jgi:hypothetical protein
VVDLDIHDGTLGHTGGFDE